MSARFGLPYPVPGIPPCFFDVVAMPILVAGASSQIGYFLCRRLCAVGQAVLALSRQPREGSGQLQWLQGSLETLPPRMGLEGVVSFAPLVPLADWLARHQRAPAPSLVATSSMSLLTKQDSTVAAERALVAALAEGEARVIAQCRRLGMEIAILRPTLVYGAGRDKSLTPIARRSARWRVAVLPGGTGWRQPVHADDIALAVQRLLARGPGDGRILAMGGGERLRAAEMFERVQAAVTPPAVAGLSVPGPLLGLAARFLPAIRGPVSRLSRDLVADNDAFIQALGFTPRPFRPSACMLGVGKDWQARLDAQPLRTFGGEA